VEMPFGGASRGIFVAFALLSERYCGAISGNAKGDYAKKRVKPAISFLFVDLFCFYF